MRAPDIDFGADSACVKDDDDLACVKDDDDLEALQILSPPRESRLLSSLACSRREEGACFGRTPSWYSSENESRT